MMQVSIPVPTSDLTALNNTTDFPEDQVSVTQATATLTNFFDLYCPDITLEAKANFLPADC